MSSGRIAQLKARSTELSQENAATFQEIVKRVALANKVDFDEVLVDLARAGKSVDDLDAAMEMLRRRQQWVSTYLKGQKAEYEYPESRKKLKTLEADFEKLKREHSEKVRPLVQSIEQSKQAIVDAARAKGQLVNSVDAVTRANILSGVMTHREELEARQREFAAQIKSKSDHISRMGGQEEYVADVAKATAALSELQKQHDGLEPAFKELATAESEAMERLLDPELI